MKTLLALTLALSVPAIATAAPPPSKTESARDARFVPVMRDGKPIGIKVYAIRAGGRFDQPTAKFQNGDTVETVDGLAVVEEGGSLAFYERVVFGKADATVVVLRKGERITLASKAKR